MVPVPVIDRSARPVCDLVVADSLQILNAPAMAPAQEASKEGKVKPEPVPKASLSQLYAFASRPQKAMLGVAFLTSGIAGLCQPMMLLAFKDMFKSLGSSVSIGGALFPSSLITRVLATMMVLASVLGVSDFIAAGLTEYVVASIMSGYKQAYLKAVLRLPLPF